MIIDGLMMFGLGIADLVLTVLGAVPIPGPFGQSSDGFTTSSSGAAGSFMGDLGFIFMNMGAMGNWIPFDVAGPAIVFIYLAALVMFGVRIGRVVLSFLTGGGGSAG